MRLSTGLTQQRVKELFYYNPETGEFRWNVEFPAGSRPGFINMSNNGTYFDKNLNKRFSLKRIIWLYMTGQEPGSGVVKFKDRKAKSLKWSSLEFIPYIKEEGCNYKERKAKLNRKKALQDRYGLTLENYEQIFNDQDGCCPICWRSNVKFHVDHCHWTGTVRGLLCRSCNMGLGVFKDDPGLLLSCVKYLLNTGGLGYRLIETEDGGVIPVDLTLGVDSEGNQFPPGEAITEKENYTNAN